MKEHSGPWNVPSEPNGNVMAVSPEAPFWAMMDMGPSALKPNYGMVSPDQLSGMEFVNYNSPGTVPGMSYGQRHSDTPVVLKSFGDSGGGGGISPQGPSLPKFNPGARDQALRALAAAPVQAPLSTPTPAPAAAPAPAASPPSAPAQAAGNRRMEQIR